MAYEHSSRSRTLRVILEIERAKKRPIVDAIELSSSRFRFLLVVVSEIINDILIGFRVRELRRRRQ